MDPFCNDHPIFGDTLDLEKLSKERFPTRLELLNVIRGLNKQVVKPNGTIERSDVIKVYTKVAEVLSEIWSSACINVPEVLNSRINLETHFKAILREASQTRNRILETSETKESFLKDLKSKIYNFSSCKCYVSAKNIYKVKSMEDVFATNCKCDDKDKILCLELYGDQLFGRELTIWVSEEIKARFQEIHRGNYINNSFVFIEKDRYRYYVTVWKFQDFTATQILHNSFVFIEKDRYRYYVTVWKFQDFTATQILLEINIDSGEEAPKTGVLTISADINFACVAIFYIFNC